MLHCPLLFLWGTISVGAGLLSSEAVARCRITFYHMLQIFGSVMSSLAVVFASCRLSRLQTDTLVHLQNSLIQCSDDLDVAVLGWEGKFDSSQIIYPDGIPRSI